MTIPENPRTPSLKDLLEEILATFQTKIRPLWSPKDPNRFRETMKALSAIKLRSSEIEQSLPGKNLASSVGVMLIFCRKKQEIAEVSMNRFEGELAKLIEELS